MTPDHDDDSFFEDAARPSPEAFLTTMVFDKNNKADARLREPRPERRGLRRRRWPLVWALAALQTALLGQTFQIDKYTENDGLPSSNVNDIAQDDLGRMWFATRNGAAVYDGVEWTGYGMAEGLPGLNYGAVAVDGQNRVWICSREDAIRVSVFENGTWRNLPAPAAPLDSVQDLTVWSAGERTYAAVGLWRSGVLLWNGRDWRLIPLAAELEGAAIRNLQRMEGQLYVSSSRGLCLVGDREIRLASFENQESAPCDLLAIAAGPVSGATDSTALWLWGDNILGFIENERFTVFSRQASSPQTHFYAYALAVDRQGNLYYGTKDRLYFMDAQNRREQVRGVGNGLADNGATAILLDREENVWIGAERGVSKIASLRFANFSIREGLAEDETASIAETPDGGFIFGHNRQLSFYRDGVWRHRPIANSRSGVFLTRIMDLAVDPDGVVWLAGSDAGLGRLLEDDRIEWLGEPAGLKGSAACLAIDDSGGVYVGGNGGLHRLENGRFHTEFPDLEIRSMAWDGNGRLLAATVRRGLGVLDRGQWRFFTLAGSEHAANAYAVLADSHGQVWLGTRAGLMAFGDGALVKASIPELDPNRPVFLLFEDHKRRLWIGTDNGVVRWDGRQARRYTKKHGLIGMETNRAAGIVDRRGRVWIGMDNGVSRYEERYDRETSPKPLVWFREINAGSQSLDLTRDHTLDFQRNSLFFNFRCVSFLDEDRVLYQTFLEGFDQTWLPAKPYDNPWLHYTNLPPGTYRLQVRAANAMGVWSEPAVSSAFRIRKPFWFQWWFLTAGALTLLGAIWLAQRQWTARRMSKRLKEQVALKTSELAAKTRELRKKNRSLSQELRERERIERALKEARAKAEAGSRAKSSFLATMSHEIRTPLNGVIANADLLRHSDLDDDQRDLLEMIQMSGEALLTVISDVLDFSRIESGKLELAREALSPEMAAVEAVEIVKSKAAERNVRVLAEIDPAAPALVWGDRARLRQVLLNLLGNAVKFTKDGETVVSVKPGERPAELQFTVRDTGIGIPEEKLGLLFQPFSQVDSAANREFGGSGLGLAISKRLVELMGGRIWAESGVGQGAAFHFTTPAQPADAAQTRPATAHGPVNAGKNARFEGMSALVVEDNSVNQKVLARMLLKLGVQADIAANGVEAIAATAQKRYDVIVMDLQMPRMDGYESASRIMASGGEPWIVACTANATREDHQRCADIGMKDFLTKPIDLEKLRDVFEKRRDSLDDGHAAAARHDSGDPARGRFPAVSEG